MHVGAGAQLKTGKSRLESPPFDRLNCFVCVHAILIRRAINICLVLK